MSLTQDIANVVQAANNLTSEVTSKMAQIDQRVDDAESEYHGLIAGIRSDFPFYRITKNQELKVGGLLTAGATGTPDGWLNRKSSIHTCEIVIDSQSGTLPAAKHPEVQALFMDLKGVVPQHTQPDFAIMRVSTDPSEPPSNISTFYSIYQGPLPNGIPYTIGMFIKVETGEARACGASHAVPADGKWHEILVYGEMANGGANYFHSPHLYVPPGSSVLIALPAVVAGKVPVGKWGFFHKPKFEHEG
ncbi:hypothetical protein KGV31_004046 [Vibrio parahaemolyticus]|nr:hypothetical protein [Vibrio parahaemolyticus]EGQ8464355.1 hypothetical protein [Vibrio parahaemolyticus]EGQ9405942.1 hypothetical protein [Vibrio parahaemolyticus]EGR0297553.1 hypothetical protein [Vibrio parahaemolyticus]EHM6955194.1 hypothetical protein [Vibrio parahaemolyticus]